jgi:hypothetical protein
MVEPPDGEGAANFLFCLMIVITIIYFLIRIYQGGHHG